MSRPVRLAALSALLALCWLAACRPPPVPPDLVRRGPRPGAPEVVVLRSTDNHMFRAPLTAFIDQVNTAVAVFTLPRGRALRRLSRTIAARRPALIFALGTRAALLAALEFPRIPVIFALVVNHRRHPVLAGPNVMGVALESDPAAEFSQFRMVLPRLARVLVFYNQAESQPLIERARRDLRQLAAEVVGLPVESTAQIRTLYQRHARGVDAVWFMNDPFVMTPEVFAFLRDRTQRDRIPFVASLSDTFARQGALMSISTELAAIGSQAAAMVRLHLEQHQTPAQIGVQPPISTRLTLNQGVARRIGVQVPDEVLPYIGEIVDEPVRSR